MRQIFLDTETTGFDYKSGHRVIELGCVESIDRKLTGHNLHFYFKPNIEVDEAAFKVHGISNDKLKNAPLFAEKIDEIMEYLKGSQLVIHNAGFDVPFLNHELSLINKNPWQSINTHCKVLDTLTLARKMHPGQRNSLDALAKRYMIDNSHRTLHGALLDAELLAHVYFAMTGGQTQLALSESASDKHKNTASDNLDYEKGDFRVVKLSEQSEKAHKSYLKMLAEKSNHDVLWK